MEKVSKSEDLSMVLGALKQGDQRVFEKLYATYYEKLCVYLLNYTSDIKIIEDVVQDTFTALWLKRKEIDVTISIKSYLYKAVYNKLIDTYRKNERANNMLSSYYNTAILHAANLDEDEKEERLKKLDDCIDELPSKCKNVFVANKISGKKYQQIALELEISLKTVEGHISRAYKLIKDCMARKR